MEFIGSPWPTITSALRKAKTRTAVTAYLTSSAEKILPLKGNGDRLFVDASPGTVAAGLTDPRVIQYFMERKVRCYSVEGLHAKVYLADGVMFCGSANATANSSSENLEEACVRVADANLIAQFEDWIATLQCDRIDNNLLKKLKAIYKRPKFRQGKPVTRTTSRAKSWIMYTMGEHDSEETDEYLERLASAEGFDVDDIDYVSFPSDRKAQRAFEDARRGDEVFIIDHDDKIRLYAPVRVIAQSKVVGDQRILALEQSLNYVTFNSLLREARSAGVKLPENGFASRTLSKRDASALRRMFRRKS